MTRSVLYSFWPFAMQLDSLSGEVHHMPFHYLDSIKFSKSHNMNHKFVVPLQTHRQDLPRIHIGKCSGDETVSQNVTVHEGAVRGATATPIVVVALHPSGKRSTH